MTEDSSVQSLEVFTHYNGDKPFRVVIEKNGVKVYKKIESCNDDGTVNYDEEDDRPFEYASNPIHTFDYVHVFVGKHEQNTDFNPEVDGNSLLVEIDVNRYVYIGDCIYSFNSLAKITEYRSPIGNSDVPYPYAIDEKGNNYLVIEHVILLNYEGLPLSLKGCDPYCYYCNENKITHCFEGIQDYQQNSPTLDMNSTASNFGNVRAFYVNGNHYELRYNPFPGQEYDKQLDDLDEEQEDDVPDDVPNRGVFVRGAEGTLRGFSREEYVELIESFGKSKCILPLHHVIIVSRPMW